MSSLLDDGQVLAPGLAKMTLITQKYHRDQPSDSAEGSRAWLCGYGLARKSALFDRDKYLCIVLDTPPFVTQPLPFPFANMFSMSEMREITSVGGKHIISKQRLILIQTRRGAIFNSMVVNQKWLEHDASKLLALVQEAGGWERVRGRGEATVSTDSQRVKCGILCDGWTDDVNNWIVSEALFGHLCFWRFPFLKIIA